MLSIFILIGAYRYYARLAHDYRKTSWHYGVLAIVIYLGTQVVVGLGYAAYLGATNPGVDFSRNFNAFSGINLLGWAVSIVAVLIGYFLLEKKFKSEKQPANNPREIEDIGKKEI